MENQPISVQALIEASVAKVWECWTESQHIVNWNHASDDWYCPKSSNDLRVGGKFSSTMAAKDETMSFDFEGIYDVVNDHETLAYTIADGRKVKVIFENKGNNTQVTETFDPENMNPLEMQQAGWQAILNNFKQYVEG